MSRGTTITISIILLIVVFLIYTRDERIQRGNTDYRIVSKLDVGEGRIIAILLDDTFLEVPGWYYEINVDGQIVVPATLLWGCCRPEVKPEYEVLFSCDNSIVGVVWTRRPGVLLAAHDFASGASWPRRLSHDTQETSIERGRSLRDRLQVDNPQTKLALSEEVP